jgi:hypothetical protein
MTNKISTYNIVIICLFFIACSDSNEMKEGSIFKQPIDKDLTLTLDNGKSYKGMYSPTHQQVNANLVSTDGSVRIPITGTFIGNEHTYKDEKEFKEKESEIIKVGVKIGGFNSTSVMDKDNIEMRFKFDIVDKTSVLGQTFTLSIDDDVIIPYCENPNSTLPKIKEKEQKIHWSQLIEFVDN